MVAEDSPTTRALLVHVLQSDPAIEVIEAVNDGETAVERAVTTRPDVVLMDIHLPGVDGFEATRRIMERRPVPIVVCSAAADPKQVDITFRSLEAGAVACIKKPVGPTHANFAEIASNLVSTVKLMSEVKVVRRTSRRRQAPPMSPPQQRSVIRIVGIGASTGGPPVLQSILAALPTSFTVPVLVVQHIARGFLPGMAEWLRDTTGFHVQIASYGLQPLPRHVYLAPDDYHMGVSSELDIILTREAPENHLRPSVSYLFRSLATHAGSSAVGVLLTGMGKDGARELRTMRDRGAVTIAQDKDSAVIHSMPGHAIALGGAMHVLPPDRIASNLAALAGANEGR